MKTHWKIPVVCLQLLLVLGLLLGTPSAVKADRLDEGEAAYNAGNYQKALEIFKPLAKQGEARAQYDLGVLYDEGKGVPQDYTEAVRWFRLAAEQGNAKAQYNMADMYGKGKGVPQDFKKEAKWYRLAAEQGLARTQYNLGHMYENGRGVPQDYAEALKWYHKAAEQGLVLAQFNLGVMYGNGMGVPQDYVLAYKWLSLSASQFQGKRHEVAVRNRKLAEIRMTPNQFAEAQKLAHEWKPKTWKELSQQK